MFSTIHPRLLKARTLVLGETDESPHLPAEPPLTREQQRAMRKSQARGRGATAESGKGRGKGRGRGRGRKKVVEDLDGESLSGTEDLPEQSMKAPASRPARAKASPKSKTPETPTGATVSPKAKAKGRAKAKAKASARKPRAKKPAAPKATPKKRAARKRPESPGKEAPKAKRERNGKKTPPASVPVPMDQRDDLKKLFSPIVLFFFGSMFNWYSGSSMFIMMCCMLWCWDMACSLTFFLLACIWH